MKKHILIAIIALIALPLRSFSDVLLKWDTSGANGAQWETQAVACADGLESTPITRGKNFASGASVAFCKNTMTFYVGQDIITPADAIAEGAYFEITVTPKDKNAGITIGTLFFSSKRASKRSGPNSFIVRSSQDNFASDIGKPVSTHPTTAPEGGDVKISFGSKLAEIKKPVTLRIYGYGKAKSDKKGILAISNHSKLGGIVLEGKVTE